MAYAILGNITKDITSQPLGYDEQNHPIFLKDIWPSSKEINEVVFKYLKPELFKDAQVTSTQEDALWNNVSSNEKSTYDWDKKSTYILKPPFLEKIKKGNTQETIHNAAILAIFGDNITTDHISPGNRISIDSQAGKHLLSKGVEPEDFSSYLQRRVNHEVMMRGTFDNAHIQNEMTPQSKGGWTIHSPSNELTTIYEAHLRYEAEKRPLIVIAGKEYGTGSSRDWAAKGPYLLGVRAIIAESFERIHRSNLIGMGILPLEFREGETRKTLGLDGTEKVDILVSLDTMDVRDLIDTRFIKPDGEFVSARLICRLDTNSELSWFKAGGVMPHILNKFKTT